MSTTSLILFKDGKPFSEIEYRNSWAGAARIWEALFNQYLKNSQVPYHNWMMAGDELWGIARDPKVPIFEKATHAFTFDRFYVKRQNFPRISRHLRGFVNNYPPGNKACHLIEWAKVLESSNADSIALWATSVTANPWQVHSEESDTYTPYNLNDAGKHVELYEWLESEHSN